MARSSAGNRGGYETFLVPYDFSSHARAALDAAVDVAGRLGADLHLIHVVQTPAYAYGYAPFRGMSAPPSMELTAVREAAMDSLGAIAGDIVGSFPGKVELHVVEGVGIAEVLCESARDHRADLIVMGTHGRTGLAHVFLGSVAERTLRGAPCPVLTVRDRSDEDGAEPGDES